MTNRTPSLGLEILEKLHKKHPYRHDISVILGQRYKILYEYDKAEATFVQLQEKFPTKHQGWEGMVNVAQHQQDWQAVIERSRLFQEAFPHLWQSY